MEEETTPTAKYFDKKAKARKEYPLWGTSLHPIRNLEIVAMVNEQEEKSEKKKVE